MNVSDVVAFKYQLCRQMLCPVKKDGPGKAVIIITGGVDCIMMAHAAAYYYCVTRWSRAKWKKRVGDR